MPTVKQKTNKPSSPIHAGLSRLNQSDLSTSGQTVSRWVLANAEQSSRLSLAELALHTQLSQPSVVRWCRALGFEGYKDFQHWLARTLGAGTPFVHASVQRTDAPWTVLTKVVDSTQTALTVLRNQLDASVLEQAVHWLSQAKRVEFYGQGNSGITAQDGAHKLFRIGVAAIAHCDPHIHSASASMLDARDVVVVISNSGRSIELLETTRIAKQAGARVIALTAPATPLAALADVLLTVNPSEDPDVFASMTARISQLVILDTLAVCLALAMGERLTSKLERYKTIIAGKRVPTKASRKAANQAT
jgi:RpiR family transcriptional regulator, carbohydrate utilization regulator